MKKIVFTLGRLNPPTLGHVKLMHQARDLASQMNCDCRFYITETQDSQKNPLTIQQKLYFLQESFPSWDFQKCKNPFQACREMSDSGYQHAVLVAGSDGDNQLYANLKKYIGHVDLEKNIGIRVLETLVVPRTIDDFSATKARKMAEIGDFKRFSQMIPNSSTGNVKILFSQLQTSMGVNNAIN